MANRKTSETTERRAGKAERVERAEPRPEALAELRRPVKAFAPRPTRTGARLKAKGKR